MDVGKRGQPLAAELIEEQGAILVGLGLASVGAVGRPGHARTGTEGVQDLRQCLAGGRDDARDGRHVVEAVALHEHLGVVVGDREAALQRVGLRVLDVEDSARGLGLEPLPHVAFVRAGRGRQRARVERTEVGQRHVEAEPVADVYLEHLHSGDVALEQRSAKGGLWVWATADMSLRKSGSARVSTRAVSPPSSARQQTIRPRCADTLSPCCVCTCSETWPSSWTA